jgi:hypothetical protein
LGVTDNLSQFQFGLVGFSSFVVEFACVFEFLVIAVCGNALIDHELKVTIYFLFEDVVVVHDDLKLCVFIDVLQRFHIEKLKQCKLNIEPRCFFKKAEDWDIIHFFMEYQISAELRNVSLQIFFREHRILLCAIPNL